MHIREKNNSSTSLFYTISLLIVQEEGFFVEKGLTLLSKSISDRFCDHKHYKPILMKE